MLKKPGNRQTVSIKKTSSKTPAKKIEKIVKRKSVSLRGKNNKNGKSGGCCGCLKKKDKNPVKKISSRQKPVQPKSFANNSSETKTPTKNFQTSIPVKSITIIKPKVSSSNIQRNFDKRAIKTPPNRTSTTQQSPEDESPRKPKYRNPKTGTPAKLSNSSIKVKNIRPISHENTLKNSHTFQEVKIYSIEFENGMIERKMIVTSIFPNNKPPKMLIEPDKSQGIVLDNTNYTTLAKANSTDKITKINLSSEAIVTSPILKSKEFTNPPKIEQEPRYRDRVLSTLNKLRTHYQLNSDEIRILSKNSDLKLIAIRAGLALQEAQRNLRNLKVLAGSNLLPDLSMFNDELSAVILKLDRFMDAMQTFSEHTEPSPTTK